MADNYTVTGQKQTTLISDNGGLVQVLQVSFKIPSIGFVGHVNVPVDRVNPANVKAAIEAAVATHTAIAGL